MAGNPAHPFVAGRGTDVFFLGETIDNLARDVRIRVAAAGLNPVDCKIRDGDLKTVPSAELTAPATVCEVSSTLPSASRTSTPPSCTRSRRRRRRSAIRRVDTMPRARTG